LPSNSIPSGVCFEFLKTTLNGEKWDPKPNLKTPISNSKKVNNLLSIILQFFLVFISTV
jgi:hypothetical protein